MLQKLSVPGRPIYLDYSRARSCGASSRCGWELLGHFSLVYLFFLPLWGKARYRLRYCLKSPLSAKQATNTQYYQADFGWLVSCFGFNDPLRQYFSLCRAVSQREGERREKIEESKYVQTTSTRTYCKRNRSLPYYHPNCRLSS